MKRRTFLKALSAMGAIAPLTTPNLARSQGTNVLKFVPQADLGVLDSVFTTAYVTRNHAFLVFDTLYGMTEAYEPQPQMVEGHSIENDGKLWTLKLREGLKFHDGQPVLARDAVASIKRWGQRDALGGSLLAATDELSAASDREIRFRLKKPFPLLPLALGRGSNTMAPDHARAARHDAAVAAGDRNGGKRPLPLRRRRARAGLACRVSALRGLRAAPHRNAKLHPGPEDRECRAHRVAVIPDAATAAAALQAGEVDWWEQPTADLLPLLKRSSAIKTEIIDRAGNIGLHALELPLSALRQSGGQARASWRHQPSGFHGRGRRHGSADVA